MFLNSIKSFSKANLSKTETVVTKKDGSKYKETISEDGIKVMKLENEEIKIFLQVVDKEEEGYSCYISCTTIITIQFPYLSPSHQQSSNSRKKYVQLNKFLLKNRPYGLTLT